MRFSRSSLEPDALGRRRLAKRPLLVRFLVAIAGAAVLAPVAWFVLGPIGLRTTLAADVLGEVEFEDGRVGTVYNFGVALVVEGPGTIRVRAAGAKNLRGLTQLDPMIGYTCDGKEGILYGDVGADVRRKPNTDLRTFREARIRGSRDQQCWYVLFRFVAERTGLVTADGAEIVYRVGLVTRRERFSFHAGVSVTGYGKDYRDTY